MNAPDKIYLHGYEFDKTPCDRWDAEPTPKKMFGYKAKFVEYIRKDALLEWAKEVHDSGPIKDSADKGDAWSIGYMSGMADLIDKLSTL